MDLRTNTEESLNVSIKKSIELAKNNNTSEDLVSTKNYVPLGNPIARPWRRCVGYLVNAPQSNLYPTCIEYRTMIHLAMARSDSVMLSIKLARFILYSLTSAIVSLATPHTTRVLLLKYWGRVTHLCVDKLTIIGSNNGLTPRRRQATIWTNSEIHY